MKKIIKYTGITLGSILGISFIFLIIIASMGPQTYIYSGNQVPKRFMKTIRALDLLNEDEKVLFFYSDALMDIETGFYLVSDKHVILYSNEWDDPKVILPFHEIDSMDVAYDSSFLDDTSILLTTKSGGYVQFPVSSEKKLDVKFVEAIQKRIETKL